MEVINDHFEIRLSDGAEVVIPAGLHCVANEWSEGGLSRRVCHITLRFHESEIEASDEDFFDAFCRVREQLDQMGLIPICYGASRNVHPSGMCRDMGHGLKAYRVEMGQQAGRDALVSIFDSGPDVDPVSVEVQKQFFDQWVRSLQGGSLKFLVASVLRWIRWGTVIGA